MVIFLTGKTGSGKSYKALYEIFNIIEKNSKKELKKKRKKIRKKILSIKKTKNNYLKRFYLLQYPKFIVNKERKKNIITNIAGLKYKELAKYAKELDSDINFYQLKSPEFNEFCELVHHYIEEYRKLPTNEEDDEDEGEMAYSSHMIRNNHQNYLKFLDSVIIFDEAGTSELWATSEQAYGKANLARLSFILVHRHMNDDLYFIVQDANLILKAYRSTVERFYVAQSSSYRKFTNKMRYFVYTSLVDIKSDFADPDLVETLPIKKEYFTFYKTGTNESGMNPFKKYIFYIVSIIIIFFSSIFYLLSTFGGKNHLEEKNNIKKERKNSNNENIKQLKENENDLLVKANSYYGTLYCKVNNNNDKYYLDINIDDLKNILEEEQKEIKFIKVSNQIMFYIDLEFIKNYFYKIQGDTNEENTNNNFTFNK